jgi:hypothetical protein
MAVANGLRVAVNTRAPVRGARGPLPRRSLAVRLSVEVIAPAGLCVPETEQAIASAAADDRAARPLDHAPTDLPAFGPAPPSCSAMLHIPWPVADDRPLTELRRHGARRSATTRSRRIAFRRRVL